jgi:hypothetical protein
MKEGAGRSCSWDRCLLPNSLTGQLIGFMLLALMLSQGISFLIYWDERGHALREALKEEFLVRSACWRARHECTMPASSRPSAPTIRAFG